jgi:putative membrane protein
MRYIFIRTLAVLVTSYLTRVGVPLAFSTFPFALGTAWTALMVAISLAVINHTVKPMFMLVAIPINFATLGLFSFILNGCMVLLADKMITSFSIPSLLMAIYFAAVLSAVNWVLHIFE